MRKLSGLSRFLLALVLLSAPLVAGCGGNPFNPPIDDIPPGLPDDTPLNDTPQNTMIRFQAIYEYQVQADYEALFASNFQFTFSGVSDPELASQYGTSWGKDDEIETSRNIFDAASVITLSGISSAQIVDEYTLPESLATYYKRAIVPSVALTIEIPNADGFFVDASQEFFLVRGDRAELDASQEARVDRWYIYRWDDKSQTPPSLRTALPRLMAAASGPRPVRATWGLVKSSYATNP